MPKEQVAEWLDERGVSRVFGLTRTPIYNLRKRGLIRSVSVKAPGASYGKRLYCVASIREFLAQCEVNEATKQEEVAK